MDEIIQEQPQDPTPEGQQLSDIDKLKTSPHFLKLAPFSEGVQQTGEFDNDLWENAKKIRETITASGVTGEDCPVYYVGAGYDVGGALAFSDATDFIFVDPIYADKNSKENPIEELVKAVVSAGGKIKNNDTFRELGNGGCQIVTFDWNGKLRKISAYGQDATTFVPPDFGPDIQHKASLLLSLGYYKQTKADQINPWLNYVAKNGFILEQGNGKAGLKEIIPQPDNFHEFKGHPLSQKVREA